MTIVFYSREIGLVKILHRDEDTSKNFKKTKKNFWVSSLPWPEKVLRKPKIRLNNVLTGKKIPSWLKSKYVILVMIYGVMFFFYSGGMYFLTGPYKDFPFWPDPLDFFINSLTDQFIIEGLLAAILSFMGFGGLLILYIASKNFYKKNRSHAYLLIGIIIVIIAIALLELAMVSKEMIMYFNSTQYEG